jgi:hypothetical protein
VIFLNTLLPLAISINFLRKYLKYKMDIFNGELKIK